MTIPMEPRTTSSFRLQCPKCESASIRKNELGDRISLVGIDPVGGTVHQGLTLEFVPSEVVPIYFCSECLYENAVPSMFIAEEGIA